MRGCVGIQKEAGILERGMQALRSALSALLGQSGDTKPEDKVGRFLLCIHSQSHSLGQHCLLRG